MDKLTPYRAPMSRFWPRAISFAVVTSCLALAVSSVTWWRPSARDVPALGTLETQNLIVDTTLQHNSATASTLTKYDASKHMTSYSGSGCGGGSALQSVNADGTVTCIAAGTGTVTSTGSAGWLAQYSSATNIQNWSGSGCGAGSALSALDGSGQATCVATGTTSTPSITIPAPVAQSASTVDLSTLGTIDWFWCPQGASSGTTEPHTQTWSTSQTDINGGFFARSFGVVSKQNWDVAAVQPITLTSPAGDSWNHANNGGTTVCETWSGTAVTSDGFAWQLPASSTQQVMRIYVGGNDVAATLTCKLTISGTTTAQTHDFGAVGNAYVVYTVTFTGGVMNEQMSCRWIVTATNSTPTAIDFAGGSLGLI